MLSPPGVSFYQQINLVIFSTMLQYKAANDGFVYPHTHTDRLLFIPNHNYQVQEKKSEHDSNSRNSPRIAPCVWLILDPTGVISIRPWKASGEILPGRYGYICALTVLNKIEVTDYTSKIFHSYLKSLKPRVPCKHTPYGLTGRRSETSLCPFFTILTVVMVSVFSIMPV